MENEKREGILHGRFFKVSQEERTIKARQEGEPDSKYYVVYLSNGIKTFDVTCGEKNPILALPAFKLADFDFDVQDRKIKVLNGVLAEEAGKLDKPDKPDKKAS